VPYQPTSAGGSQSQFWSDHKEFGGFLKGIENDGARDVGLDYFANPSLAATVDTSIMESCIARNLSRSDRSFIQGSNLVAQLGSRTATSRQFRLGFSDSNEFSAQENSLLPVDKAGWDGSEDRDVSNRFSKAVAEVEVTVGSQRISAQITKKTEFEMELDLGIEAALVQVRTNLAASQAKIDNWENLKNNPPRDPQLENLQDEVERREDRLQTEQNRTPRDDAQIATAENRLNQARADLAAYQAANPIPDYTGLIEAEELVHQALNLERIRLENLAATPPKIEIISNPVDGENGRRTQPHLLDFEVKLTNTSSFKDAAGNTMEPVIRIQAYDPTFYRSRPIGNVNPNLVKYINLKANGLGVMEIPTGLSATSGSGTPATGDLNSTDLSELDEICENARISTSSSAFGGASWDYSFAANTRHSWNFAGSNDSANPSPSPLVSEMIFDGGNSRAGVTAFRVQSIVGRCIIRDSAELIAGFLTCDELVIQGRSKPLRIIGTIIANSVSIDRSAFLSGIRWSSIYHPQATLELRSGGILKSYSSNGCDSMQSPVWHPIPSMTEVADRYNCNVISLRAKANPFQWTTVDPDCGYVPGNATSTCKNRLIRFFVIEHQRETSF